MKPKQTQQTLKNAVRETAEKVRLPDEQVDKLLAMQAAHFESTATTTTNHFSAWLVRSKMRVGSIAVVVLMLLSVSLWTNKPQDYTQQIALEVVKNHLNLKSLDVETQSIDGIRSYFTQLDFLPLRSTLLQENFALSDSNLLGGRYCSIKGVTAAQLHYQPTDKTTGEDGSIATFYQVDYDPDLHGKIPDLADNAEPTVLSVKGLEVSLWIEKGLLLVLVTEG